MPRKPNSIIPPEVNRTPVRVQLTFDKCFIEDYMPRFRTFNKGMSLEHIIEHAVRYVGQQSGFSPQEHDPMLNSTDGSGRRKKKADVPSTSVTQPLVASKVAGAK